eukprot:sb/3470298/
MAELATLACNNLPSSLPHLPVRIKGLLWWVGKGQLGNRLVARAVIFVDWRRCLVLFLHSFPFFNQPLSSSTPRPLTSARALLQNSVFFLDLIFLSFKFPTFSNFLAFSVSSLSRLCFLQKMNPHFALILHLIALALKLLTFFQMYYPQFTSLQQVYKNRFGIQCIKTNIPRSQHEASTYNDVNDAVTILHYPGESTSNFFRHPIEELD